MSRASSKPTKAAGAAKRIAKTRPRAATKAALAATRATGKGEKLAPRKPFTIAGKLVGKSAGNPKANAPRTLTEFMAQALAMEREAAQRYSDFADAMEIHNNREVAALFRKMAGIERKHAERIMAEMGWKDTPALPSGRQAGRASKPETAPGDECTPCNLIMCCNSRCSTSSAERFSPGSHAARWNRRERPPASCRRKSRSM